MPRNRRSETEPAHFTPHRETIEIVQPDPELQEDVAGPGRIAVYAIVGLVVLGFVLYGLNQPWPETVAVQQNTSNSSASTQQPATTGAASQDVKPQPPAGQQGQPQQEPQPGNPQSTPGKTE